MQGKGSHLGIVLILATTGLESTSKTTMGGLEAGG